MTTTGKAPLSRERIVEAAVELADEQGIDAVSMRNLAERLDSKAMSLYRHVENKEDLVAAMVDAVAVEIGEVDDGAEWRDVIRERAMHAYGAFRRHPWATPLWMVAQVGEARERLMEATLRTFRRAGFSPRLTHHAFHALDNHILGHAFQAMSFRYDGDELVAAGREFLTTLDTDEFPFLAEHVMEHIEPSESDGMSDFAFGLDLILDGLERLRDRV